MKRNKKITLDIIKLFANKIGYTIISNEYNNIFSKLEIKCSKGHIYKIRSDHFYYNKKLCKICSKNERNNKKLKKVTDFIKIYNYKCISTEYVNNYTKLKFECDKGHKFETNWGSIQSGSKCPICAGVKRKTIEEVRRRANERKYILLSTEYINNYTKLKFKCPKGHLCEICWSEFNRGSRCYECWRESIEGDGHWAWIPNREQVYKGYTDKFFNKNYRDKILNEQKKYLFSL